MIHKFLALPTPDQSFFKQYKQIILEFIWDNKPARISYNHLIQQYDKMGLKLGDLATKNFTLKASWPV